MAKVNLAVAFRCRAMTFRSRDKRGLAGGEFLRWSRAQRRCNFWINRADAVRFAPAMIRHDDFDSHFLWVYLSIMATCSGHLRRLAYFFFATHWRRQEYYLIIFAGRKRAGVIYRYFTKSF